MREPLATQGRYRGLLFDLFGTLILVDRQRISTIMVNGRAVRSTLGAMEPLLRHLVPGVAAPALMEALQVVTTEMIAERGSEHREFPSRERFRRALARLGLVDEEAAFTAVVLSRRHLAAVADATYLPADHLRIVTTAARSRRVGIISNFDDAATARMLLERHGVLSLVGSVVVSESVGFRKPNPALIRIALHELGVSPGEALLVGDTFEEDVAAAHAAGVDVAWIDTKRAGVPLNAKPPRFVLGSLAEIDAILARG